MATKEPPAHPVSGHSALDTIPATDREWLQGKTREILTLAHRQATDIIRIGAAIEEVKRRLKHGAFMDWVKAELPFSQPTVHRFRQVARVFANIVHGEQFEPSALYILAQEGTTQAAREHAAALASEGQRITKSLALEIVDANPDDEDDEPDEPAVAPNHPSPVQSDEDDEEWEDDEEDEESDEEEVVGAAAGPAPAVKMRKCLGLGCDREFPERDWRHFCPACRRERDETEVDTAGEDAQRAKRWAAFEELVNNSNQVRVERVDDGEDDDVLYSVTAHREDGAHRNAIHRDLYAAVSGASGNPEMRFCSGDGCGEKPIHCFGLNASNPGGFMYRCTACEKKRRAGMREAEREAKRAKKSGG